MKKFVTILLITTFIIHQSKSQSQSQIDEVVSKYASQFEWIIKPKYADILEIPNCNILTAKEKKKYGFIGLDEKVIIPFQYGYASSVGEMGYAIWAKDFMHWHYYIDVNTGKAPFEGKFQYADLFYNGYALVGQTRAIIDSTGKVVFPYHKGFIDAPDNIGDIIEGKSDDLIPFKEYKDIGEGKSGYVNKKGEWIIKPQYTYTKPRTGDYYIVNNRELYGLLDLKGQVFVAPQYQLIRIGDPYIYVQKEGKWGMMNKNGELVLPCEYDFICEFDNEGKAYYEKDNSYGYIYIEGLKIKENGNLDRSPVKLLFGVAKPGVYKVFNYEGIHGKKFGVCKFKNDKCIVKLEAEYTAVKLFWHNDKQYIIVSIKSGLKYSHGLYNDKLELIIDPEGMQFFALDPPNPSGYMRICYKNKFGVVKLK